MGKRFGTGQVVNGDDLEQIAEAAFVDRLEHLTPNPAKPIDADANGHCSPPW
jgi:hypothetical protein